MTTYPSGAVLPAGATEMINGTDPNVWYTDATGTFRFYLLGGMAPWPGVQNGMVCTEWPRNMSPPFKHLDLQGAQQDGVTWQATVYDPPDVILPLEAHGTTPQNLSKVVSEWIGAWDPKKPGILEYFTLDRGYWFCNPRLSKVWADQIKLSPRRHLKQKVTHAFRIDDAFWRSVPSTSTFSGLGDEKQKLQVIPGAFSAITGGGVQWGWGGHTTTNVAYNATSLAMQSAFEALPNIGAGNIEITGSAGGPWTATFLGPLGGSVQPLISVVASTMTGGVFPFLPYAQVDRVQAGGEGIGFIPLTNIGDQDAWPSFLVYAGTENGATFSFGNGPAATSMITFGPLAAGQVVLITSMPRLRSVVDLTPTPLPPQALNFAQEFLEGLINLLTGASGALTVGNTSQSSGVPPLLQWFESLFGIAPPQGNLYSLLNGRFTKPIPGVPQPYMAKTVYIPASISGGSATTKIVASITPQRRWPE